MYHISLEIARVYFLYPLERIDTMAKAKKLPSGQWRTLVYHYTDENGKRHYESFTADSKKESEYMAAEFALDKNNFSRPATLKLGQAMDNYIESKSNILSPSTIKEYKRMQEKYYKTIIDIPVKKMTQDAIQKWANYFSLKYSPKTVRNAYGLIEAVMKIYNPGLNLYISLPQRIKPSLYVPSDSDIKALIDYFGKKDKNMELAVYLAAFGTLRRSEICALEATDLSGDTLHIWKAMVITPDLEWIIKTTKTESSDRYVKMPEFVLAKFPTEGKLVTLNPSQITMRFNRVFQKLRIPHFRFHDLRHYAASIMHAIGVPDQYIMERGGWSSDRTLKNIYRGTIEDYQKVFTNRTIDHFENMQHEMQHNNKNT